MREALGEDVNQPRTFMPHVQLHKPALSRTLAVALAHRSSFLRNPRIAHICQPVARFLPPDNPPVPFPKPRANVADPRRVPQARRTSAPKCLPHRARLPPPHTSFGSSHSSRHPPIHVHGKRHPIRLSPLWRPRAQTAACAFTASLPSPSSIRSRAGISEASDQ